MNRICNKTVTNLNLTTEDNVTRESFEKHIKRFAFIVVSSVNDMNKMTIQRTKIGHDGSKSTLDAAASGRRLQRKKKGGGGGGE